MKLLPFLLLSFIFMTNITAQDTPKDDLPYYEVPEYYSEYTAGTMAARMVDGLGFRYRWATEDLREEDLAYEPNDVARSTGETIDHILDLSRVIVNATLKTPNDRSKEKPDLNYEQKRRETLENFKTASEILQNTTDFTEMNLHFVSTKGERKYPFWNNINGPIADAIWHSGQIASFRRSSGNPISPKVRFLQGKIEG